MVLKYWEALDAMHGNTDVDHRVQSDEVRKNATRILLHTLALNDFDRSQTWLRSIGGEVLGTYTMNEYRIRSSSKYYRSQVQTSTLAMPLSCSQCCAVTAPNLVAFMPSA
jgi:hypothetical protein